MVNMTNRTTMYSILAAILLVTACKKDDNTPAPISNPSQPIVNPLRQVFAQNVTNATQQFTVNASSGGFVTGTDGVSASFAPNAFRMQNGSTVTGDVQITLVEALEVGDMLWLNKQTLGNDNGQMRPLVSGGQFFLNATQSGQQLRLAPGATFVNVPTTSFDDPNMAVFSGTVDGDGIATWDPWDNNPLQNVGDSTGYNFPNDSLGWVNCDYFMGGSPLTGVQVTCPVGHTNDNTFVWIVFTAQNSMTGISVGSTNVFSTGSYYQLPVGMNVQVVALSKINDVYSSSFTSAVVTQGMNLSITLQPTSLLQFQLDAQAL